MWTRRRFMATGLAAGTAMSLPRPALAATDQLRLALRGEPPHLDPTAGEDPLTLAVSYQNIFEGLTRIDETGAVQPGLAKAWSLSPDGLSYRFSLRQGVRYHDGTGFDARHVVFSLERLLAPASESPNRALFHGIAGVTAPDETTIVVKLTAADPQLAFKLGTSDAVIVAPESAPNNRAEPIGTGPFDFVEWDAGRGIVLERNEDYWGTHPLVTQADFYFIAEAEAALASLAQGGIDGYPDFPSPKALQPLRSSPAFKVIDGKGPAGRPRVGVWNAGLTGMWADTPAGGCPLAEVHWAADTSTPQIGPTPFITNAD